MTNLIKILSPFIIVAGLYAQRLNIHPFAFTAADTSLKQASDFHLVGGTRLPCGSNACTINDQYAYSNQGSLSFNKVSGNSLFVMGAFSDRVMEIAIPNDGELGTSGNINTYPTATRLHDAVDPSAGHMDYLCADGPGSCSGIFLFGILQLPSNHWLVCGAINYDTGNSPYNCIKTNNPFTDTPAVIGGPYKFTSQTGIGGAYAGGNPTEIPSTYQASLGGKKYLIGSNSLSIASRTSQGPDAIAFNIEDLVDSPSNTPTEALLAYTIIHPTLGAIPGGLDTQCSAAATVNINGFDQYSCLSAASQSGPIILGRSAIYFGTNGTNSNGCYGPGVNSPTGNSPTEPPVTANAFNDGGLTGTDASTSMGGLRVTLPNQDLSRILAFSAGTIAIMLDNRTLPVHRVFPDDGGYYNHMSKVVGGGNSGTASAYVTVDEPFEDGLTGQAYTTGDISCNDPTATAKGNHAYPYNYFVWAYDINRLIDVHNNTKNYWEPVPYTNWIPTFPIESPNGSQVIGGQAYDGNRRVYIITWYTDGIAPIIWVYDVGAPAPTPLTLLFQLPTVKNSKVVNRIH